MKTDQVEPDVTGSAGPVAAPTTAERRRDVTRRRLMDGAMAVFGDRGVDDASIAAITEAAGLGVGTFYLHFDDKDDLAAQLSDVVIRTVLKDEELVATQRPDLDPLSALCRGLVAAADFDVRLLDALLRWNPPSATGPDGVPIDLRGRLAALITDRFQLGVAKGAYRPDDPSLAAHAVLGALAGCIRAYREEVGRWYWSDISRMLQDVVVSMFRRW